jgi:hypothetical protein
VALFNRAGADLAWGEVQTDAEKIVLRYQDEEVTDWAAVRARRVRVGGQERLRAEERVTRESKA